MFAQVIPARRMPLGLQYLDYLVPSDMAGDIKAGQLVKIPFRSKEIFGIINELKTETRAKEAKPIAEIISTTALLSKQQIAFLEDMSEFYKTSLGFLLKTNLLPLQKRKLKYLSKLVQNFDSQKQTAKKPGVFLYKNFFDKITFLISTIGEENGQTLLLVPEIASLMNLKKILPAEAQDKVVFIAGDMGNKELFAKWIDVWTGSKKIVMGTRSALFLPWHNLRTIILDDEANQNYKSWDMAPRLHTRDAVIFLAKHHNAKLYLMGHTPSVETFFFAKNKIYYNESKIPQIQTSTEIIDLRNERKAHNYSFLSNALVDEFKTISGDVFFFLNRRGSSSYVGCRDCGNVIKCPKCNRSMNFHEDANRVVCHFDKYFEPMIESCKKCNGINMAMFGAGTQLVETTIHRLLGSANKKLIIRIDSDQNDIEKLNTTEDKIIIGTQLAWPRLDWKKIKLMAFVDADSSLFIPEYKIAENLWWQVRDAQYNLQNGAKIIIQTANPDHIIFKSLFNPESFYNEQLNERRALGYPPFKFIVKLLYGNSSREMAERESEKLAADLTALTKIHQDITISGPLQTAPYFYGGQFWQVILAKIKYESYKQSTKLLLTKVPKTWKVDPNPNSILCL